MPTNSVKSICMFACRLTLQQDTSAHDGDWQYYKEQAYLQRNVISQLTSMLETYGYHLPKVSSVYKNTTFMSVWVIRISSPVLLDNMPYLCVYQESMAHLAGLKTAIKGFPYLIGAAL